MAEVREPYAYAAEEWREAGWSPLPLPPRKKKSPPEGYTGNDGIEADAQQVSSWIINNADGNIGLRMPPGTAGIDVDAYKPEGKRSWAELQAACGELPATYVLTSRTDGESGIRLFRIPLGVRLKGAPRPGMEIIQHHHRYAVAWPSIHPDTGQMYRLIGPDGSEDCELPRPESLPALPQAWIDELAEPVIAQGQTKPKEHVGEWSKAVSTAFSECIVRMTTGHSRHDAALAGVAALCRLESQHHPGATDALEKLGLDFRERVTRDEAGKMVRKPEQARKEWDDMVAGGRRLVAGTAAVRATWDELTAPADLPVVIGNRNGHEATTTPTTPLVDFPVLPEKFWEARPVLRHIRQAAHARTRAADVVLHSVLARFAAYTPHYYEIPPIVGSAASLNYFALVVGPSGAGKTSGVGVAGELVTQPPTLNVADNMPLGSGEGLAELYMGTVEEDDGKGKKAKVRRQVRFNAFVYGDEGAALNAMMERKGQTLPEALRRAWTGADLGQANASTERTRVIHEGMYRLGVLVGFQPELAGQLLADAPAGTPQRFCWACAIDPHLPDEPPEWPGPLELPRIPIKDVEAHETAVRRGIRRVQLGVAENIADGLRTAARARVRGEASADALDSHEPLHRLKLAGLFALMDGRLDIDDEDWWLADIVWGVSQRVRASVIASVAAHLEREQAGRFAAAAQREMVVQVARQSAGTQVEMLARRIARWVHKQDPQPAEGYAKRDLVHRLKSSEKAMGAAAIDQAVVSGWLREDDERYFAGESRPA